jgi:hypothetical protein
VGLEPGRRETSLGKPGDLIMAFYEIASPLSQQVLERRRRLSELATPALDNSYRRLYRVADLRPFIADPDMDGGDGAIVNPATRAEGEPVVPRLHVREQD